MKLITSSVQITSLTYNKELIMSSKYVFYKAFLVSWLSVTCRHGSIGLSYKSNEKLCTIKNDIKRARCRN